MSVFLSNQYPPTYTEVFAVDMIKSLEMRKKSETKFPTREIEHFFEIIQIRTREIDGFQAQLFQVFRVSKKPISRVGT